MSFVDMGSFMEFIFPLIIFSNYANILIAIITISQNLIYSWTTNIHTNHQILQHIRLNEFINIYR